MPILTNRWAVLALLFYVRACFAMQLQSVAPLVPFLVHELRLSYAEVGLLIGLYLLPGSLLALPGGILGARIGEKPILVGGLTLMVAGSALFGLSPSFVPALAGRLLGGVGGVLLIVQQARIITDRFPGRELPIAMGIILAAYPLGIALALTTLAPLADATSWRTAIHAITALIALALALVVLLYREAPRPSARRSITERSHWALSRRELGLIVSISLIWLCLNAAYLVFLGFTPAYLVTRGLGAGEAGILAGLPSWLFIGSVPLGGWLTNRSGRPNLSIVLGSVFAAASILLVGLGGPVWPGLILYGLTIGAAPGAIMALPAEVLAPEHRSTGFGVFYTVYYLGMAVFPPIAGWLQDRSGDPASPLYFASLMMLLTAGALWFFRGLQRRLTPAV
jgi:MFS family permease